MAKSTSATAVRPPHPCTRHDSTCPPAVEPPRPLGRRILRGLVVTVALLVVAFTVGQLMLASHLPTETINLVGLGAVAGVFLLGLCVIRRAGR